MSGFNVTPSRSDGAKNGSGPDPRDPACSSLGWTFTSPPFATTANREKMLRIRSHDFH